MQLHKSRVTEEEICWASKRIMVCFYQVLCILQFISQRVREMMHLVCRRKQRAVKGGRTEGILTQTFKTVKFCSKITSFQWINVKWVYAEGRGKSFSSSSVRFEHYQQWAVLTTMITERTSQSRSHQLCFHQPIVVHIFKYWNKKS